MNRKENFLAALNHKQPSRIPVDSGATSVTGMHVNCVAKLRDYYGLEKRLVKVHEPYQMLGFIEEDLQEALGIDAIGLFPSEYHVRFPNKNWKEWRLPNGLEVLVSGEFKTSIDANGDILMYPQGDISAPPSAKMPKDGFFFDTIIRQEPVDDANLNPADNCEEFAPISYDALAHFETEANRLKSLNRPVVATFGGTAFGDIALVPAPFLKHPKGIRDIEEWYVSTGHPAGLHS